MNRLILTLSIFSLSVGVAVAQQDTLSQQWNLETCIAYAITNNLEVKQSVLTVESAAIDLDQSKSNRLPDLNARLRHYYSFGQSEIGSTGEFEWDNFSSDKFRIESDLVLYKGLYIRSLIERNELLLEASNKQLEWMKSDISLQVANAYLLVLFSKELVENAAYQIATSKEQLSRTEKLVKAGSLPASSALDMKAQVAGDNSELTLSKNNLVLANLSLRQLLQINLGTPFDVLIPEIKVSDVLAFDQSVSSVYEKAETVRPEIVYADLIIRSAEQDISLAKSERLPTLTLNARVGTDQDVDLIYVDATEFQGNLREKVTLDLAIPIFNQHQVKNNVALAVIEKERAEFDAQNERNVLRQAIEKAYTDVHAAINNYYAIKDQVEALRLTLENTEDAYEVGRVSSVDLRIARNNHKAADTQFVQAKYNYIFAIMILDYYQGNPLRLN